MLVHTSTAAQLAGEPSRHHQHLTGCSMACAAHDTPAVCCKRVPALLHQFRTRGVGRTERPQTRRPPPRATMVVAAHDTHLREPTSPHSTRPSMLSPPLPSTRTCPCNREAHTPRRQHTPSIPQLPVLWSLAVWRPRRWPGRGCIDGVRAAHTMCDPRGEPHAQLMACMND